MYRAKMKLSGCGAKKSKWKRVLSAALVGGLLLVGGDQALAEAATDGMQAFREVYFATPSPDRRLFREDVTFFGPAFHADIDCMGQTMQDGNLAMFGSLDWMFTDLDTGKTNRVQIPFYVDGQGSTIYAKRDRRWAKIALPGLPVMIFNALRTADSKDAPNDMSAIKRVELLQETEKQRSMRITLDSARTAALLETSGEGDIAALPPAEQDQQRQILRRMARAVRDTEVTLVWVVDKTTWLTKTASVDFTDLVRAYAKGVLKEAENGSIQLANDERAMLDTIGYYSEMRLYLSYMGDQNADLAVPSEVRQSATERDVFADLRADVISTVEK